MIETLIGDTVQLTWIDSATAVDSDIAYSVYTGSETIVDTGTLVESGNGHYYQFITVPDAPGNYVVETLAIISGLPFKRRQMLHLTLTEVD